MRRIKRDESIRYHVTSWSHRSFCSTNTVCIHVGPVLHENKIDDRLVKEMESTHQRQVVDSPAHTGERTRMENENLT